MYEKSMRSKLFATSNLKLEGLALLLDKTLPNDLYNYPKTGSVSVSE